jgi:hypothetical protein
MLTSKNFVVSCWLHRLAFNAGKSQVFLKRDDPKWNIRFKLHPKRDQRPAEGETRKGECHAVPFFYQRLKTHAFQIVADLKWTSQWERRSEICSGTFYYHFQRPIYKCTIWDHWSDSKRAGIEVICNLLLFCCSCCGSGHCGLWLYCNFV